MVVSVPDPFFPSLTSNPFLLGLTPCIIACCAAGHPQLPRASVRGIFHRHAPSPGPHHDRGQGQRVSRVGHSHKDAGGGVNPSCSLLPRAPRVSATAFPVWHMRMLAASGGAPCCTNRHSRRLLLPALVRCAGVLSDRARPDSVLHTFSTLRPTGGWFNSHAHSPFRDSMASHEELRVKICEDGTPSGMPSLSSQVHPLKTAGRAGQMEMRPIRKPY